MFKRLFSHAHVKADSPLKDPFSRVLRMEPLESRRLLSVGNLDGFCGPIRYEAPTYVPSQLSATELAPSEETAFYGPVRCVAPTYVPPTASESDLSFTSSLPAPPNLDAVADEEADMLLDRLENTVSYAESDEVERLDPAFFVDGDAYYSLSEVMAKRLVFENQAPSTPTSDDVIFISEPTSHTRSGANGLRSGGDDGGEEETWYVELTCDSTYTDQAISYVYQNALIEGRDFDVSGGGTQSNLTYLKITAPAVPTNYLATIKFAGSATAGNDYDVYFKYDNYWTYNAPGDISYSGGSTTFYIFPKNDALFETVETVEASLHSIEPLLGSGGEDFDHVTFTYGARLVTASIIDDDQWEVTIQATDSVALEPCAAMQSDAELSGSFVVSRVPTTSGQFLSTLSQQYTLDNRYSITVELKIAEPTAEDDVTASPQDYELRTTLTGSSCGTTISIPANETQRTVYVRARPDLLFEKDELVKVSLKAAWGGNVSNAFNYSNGIAEITIIQAPEFVSCGEQTPLEDVNPDVYTLYIDPDRVYGDEGFLFSDFPIVAAVPNYPRSARYIFYSPTMGNSQTSSITAPLLSINQEIGEISVLRKMTEAEKQNPPVFTIKAFDWDYLQSYDLATLVVRPLTMGLHVDTDRNNVINALDENGKDEWVDTRGAIILYNGDDDDGDHEQDNLDAFINYGDLDDVGELWVDKMSIQSSEIPADFEIELTLEQVWGEDDYWGAFDPDSRIRIFWPSQSSGSDLVCGVYDSLLLGRQGASQTGGTVSSRNSVVFAKNPTGNQLDISAFAGSGMIKLGIEGVIPGSPISVRARYYRGSNLLADDSVALKVTPFIAFSHEAAVETNRNDCGSTVFVSDLGSDNANLRLELRAQYATALSQVAQNATGGDIWWQDPFEIGYVQAPYGSQYVILALPRSKRLDSYGIQCKFLQYAKSSMLRNNVGLYEEFATGVFNHQNDGGNFEVMPGDNSKHNSLGKIIMGIGPYGRAMNTEIVDFLVAQGVQDVISDVDLSWMDLGHIDEVISFATSPDGRARVASPDAAWALLVYAQKRGLGQQRVFQVMRRPNGVELPYNVDELLEMDFLREWNTDKDRGYSKKIQTNIIQRFGLNSPTYSEMVFHNGTPNGILSKVGYLEGYDVVGDGGNIEWKLVFTDSSNYKLYYRENEMSNWTFDGNGNSEQDFISDSGICYILKNYWNSGTTSNGNYITFKTHPSEKFIEMPVLFRNTTNEENSQEDNFYKYALAYTNNVVNSLVDGNRIFVADVQGPVDSSINVFNNYANLAVRRVGFTIVNFCEEMTYHTCSGSIHCGTTVLRVIPEDDLEWWNLFED